MPPKKYCEMHELQIIGHEAQIQAILNKLPGYQERMMKTEFIVESIKKDINDIGDIMRKKDQDEENKVIEKNKSNRWLIGVIGIGLLAIFVNLFTHFSQQKEDAKAQRRIETIIENMVVNR